MIKNYDQQAGDELPRPIRLTNEMVEQLLLRECGINLLELCGGKRNSQQRTTLRQIFSAAILIDTEQKKRRPPLPEKHSQTNPRGSNSSHPTPSPKHSAKYHTTRPHSN